MCLWHSGWTVASESGVPIPPFPYFTINKSRGKEAGNGIALGTMIGRFFEFWFHQKIQKRENKSNGFWEQSHLIERVKRRRLFRQLQKCFGLNWIHINRFENDRNSSFKNRKTIRVVVAWLVERLLSLPEICCSNPVIRKLISNICLPSTVLKRRK